ncbi:MULTISPECIES: glutaredoxin 2 [Vibrio]|uniref:Glutaredoxin 2 n=2 Tax=Vibrio TaxID=662 RepID=A0A7X4RUY3_9VIBR|nr:MULTISPECIES: glutaredoxin 2 [Vibrio]MBF9000411.1 glutaredoxin 2 [Vibrio nitrifigilis]MZI93579.1 glutaredoxin 2 [Vibrio eleionomae]
MKLFIFHHCPFCVKATMAAGYKKLDVEWVFLQNHDVDARISKVGANMVPILQKPDGSYMGESLDIVQYLDNFDGTSTIQPAQQADQVSQWLKETGFLASVLLYPRWFKLNLPEFETAEARAWFTKNKTAMIDMSFEDALAHSEEYIQQINAKLEQLTWLTLPSSRGGQLSYDDINLYPFLRNYTAVKGVLFPEKVRQYIDEVTELTQVPLYDDVAV